MPDLQKLIDDPETAPSALFSTLKLGWAKLPLLERGLAHTNGSVREMTVFVMTQLISRRDATNYFSQLIPIFQPRLKDPAPTIRQFAASGLARAADQETGIAALICNLQDPVRTVRFAAASEFQVFGSEADVAIPRLLELREDPGIRKEVEMALAFIRAASDNKKESSPLEGTAPNF